ncbi:MAG TPA: PA14 domain-containing protein, partial [Verrucomicrobiae bacterium]
MAYCLPNFARWIGIALIMSGMAARLRAAEIPANGGNISTQDYARQLLQTITNTNCESISIDLSGQVLWSSVARSELVLQTIVGALPVKMDLAGQPALLAGQHVHLVGNGTAGQGFLNEALINNDGIHMELEKSASIFLAQGMHPIHLEWFNGPVDFSLQVDYAGPGLARQKIPENALFHQDASDLATSRQWQPGLNYRCYEGSWDWLPHWQSWLPVKTGTTTNFDLGVRTRDQLVGLAFSGGLQIDQAGTYTFWLKSDDGSRLFVGDSPLQIQTSDLSSLPTPRVISPGQTLDQNENYFWATGEGTVTSLHVDPAGGLELELSEGTNRMYLESDAANICPPALFSRIRATGVCCGLQMKDGKRVAGRLLISATNQIQVIFPGPSATNPPVATLADLRQRAASGQRISAPLCLTGTVVTAASPDGYFAFQDQTGGVLVQMNSDQALAPGQQIVLTGNGVWDRNRLFLNDAALINNDGIHNRQERMGAAFLHAGRHAIHVSWFNRVGGVALEVDYQGPKLSRRKIPNDALSRVEITEDKKIKWVQGLNYSYYNGDWQQVPAASRLDPVKTGTTTNFEVRLANPAEKSALEFNGFLNVPRDGQYFFTLASDDGSLLFLDEQPVQVQTGGLGEPPVPVPI